MTFRLDQAAKEALERGSRFLSSVRRQAPGARMIGKFTVDHLTKRVFGPKATQSEPERSSDENPQD